MPIFLGVILFSADFGSFFSAYGQYENRNYYHAKSGASILKIDSVREDVI